MTTTTITSLTPIRYRDGYIEIAHRYTADEMPAAIEEAGECEVVEPAVNWGDNTHVVRDQHGGYHLARVQE